MLVSLQVQCCDLKEVLRIAACCSMADIHVRNPARRKHLRPVVLSISHHVCALLTIVVGNLSDETSQGVGLDAMNAGEQPVIGLTDTYTQPGVYTLEIPCPRTRSTATIHIEMTDEASV